MKGIKTISRSRLLLALAAVLVGAGASGAGMADAQQARRLPFSAGEQATYQVKLGAISVGSGSLAVTGIET
ncbi:MAG TPA: hypothetical protein VLK84_20745, partial [Longimicrobium sp.]|nr:hypothetical protein [Longimicrobium sp.]